MITLDKIEVAAMMNYLRIVEEIGNKLAEGAIQIKGQLAAAVVDSQRRGESAEPKRPELN